MKAEMENPAARAGAHRAVVTKLVGKNDFDQPTKAVLELQVRRVLDRYAVSFPLAVVVAELAFSSGRSS